MYRVAAPLLVLSLLACATAPLEDGASAGEAALGEVPACARAHTLFRAIHDGAKDVIAKGPIPDEVFATARNRVDPEVLVDGPAIFPAMAELIGRAEREILFQTFVWDDSIATQTIADGFGRLQARLCPEAHDAEGRARCARERGQPPIVARFVVDASKFGIHSDKPSVVGPMVARALEGQALDPALIRWEVGTFEHTTVGNTHAKTLVVDGREAIITGANPQPQHDPVDPAVASATRGPWHDTGYHVSGEVAKALAADFDYAWGRSMEWLCGSSRKKDCERKTKPIDHVTLPTDIPAETCSPILVIGRKKNANPFNNRTDNTQDQAFLAAFRAAQKHIHIETPNLNDDHAKRALLEAVEHGGPDGQGVIVDVVLAKEFNETAMKLPGQGGTNGANVRKFYETLREHGVANPCERLRIRWYSYDGKQPVTGNGPRANHSKYATIDDTVAIVGSTNLDTQSWNNAHEVDLVIDDPAVTQEWDRQVFLRDFERGIVVDECAAR